MQLTDARTETSAEAEELGRELYALVVYLHKNCNADLFEALGALDLTFSQIKLLHHLEDRDTELSVKELAELVGLSLPAASRTVDDLVRRGLAERREDPDDRRMKRVQTTDTGRAVSRRLNAARLSGMQKFAASLDESQRHAVADALAVLMRDPEITACLPEGPTE
jgi:DNA-binding MarR family transcriptional regulator